VKRSGPLKRSSTPMKRSPMAPPKAAAPANGAKPKAARKLTSHERPVSAAEKQLWDRMASEIGCIACRVAGRATSEYVSIHHIDGRTRPGCHLLVLPLCAGCHQQGTGNDKSLVAVHPNKARFEKLYGSQLELLDMIHAILGMQS
jgi:hypothetical protein